MNSLKKQRSDFYSHHCAHPVRIRVPGKNNSVALFVPCGTCRYCLSHRQNDWVSRMRLHTETYKYLYFVTLTYDSQFLISNSLFAEQTKSKKNNGSLLPLVLYRPHLQNFYKRLRNSLTSPISFVYCGEYGSNYGRPHYHNVIWSDYPISLDVFQKAWSIESVPIGIIDYKVLKDPYIDSQDSSKVFKYVSKYVTKQKIEDFKQSVGFNLIIKHYGKDFIEQNFTKIKPFFGFSKTNSIAKRYYLENQNTIDFSGFQIGLPSGEVVSIPKSFRNFRERYYARFYVASPFTGCYCSLSRTFNRSYLDFLCNLYFTLLNNPNWLDSFRYSCKKDTGNILAKSISASKLFKNFKIKDFHTNIVWHFDPVKYIFYSGASVCSVDDMFDFITPYQQQNTAKYLRKIHDMQEQNKNDNLKRNSFLADFIPLKKEYTSIIEEWFDYDLQPNKLYEFFESLDNSLYSNFKQSKEVF